MSLCHSPARSILLAVDLGYLDEVDVDDIERYEIGLWTHMERTAPRTAIHRGRAPLEFVHRAGIAPGDRDLHKAVLLIWKTSSRSGSGATTSRPSSPSSLRCGPSALAAGVRHYSGARPVPALPTICGGCSHPQSIWYPSALAGAGSAPGQSRPGAPACRHSSQRGLCGAYNDLVARGADQLITSQPCRATRCRWALWAGAGCLPPPYGQADQPGVAAPTSRVATMELVNQVASDLREEMSEGTTDAVYILYSPYRAER